MPTQLYQFLCDITHFISCLFLFLVYYRLKKVFDNLVLNCHNVTPSLLVHAYCYIIMKLSYNIFLDSNNWQHNFATNTFNSKNIIKSNGNETILNERKNPQHFLSVHFVFFLRFDKIWRQPSVWELFWIFIWRHTNLV